MRLARENSTQHNHMSVVLLRDPDQPTFSNTDQVALYTPEWHCHRQR